jgi:hypothetical protein
MAWLGKGKLFDFNIVDFGDSVSMLCCRQKWYSGVIDAAVLVVTFKPLCNRLTRIYSRIQIHIRKGFNPRIRVQMGSFDEKKKTGGRESHDTVPLTNSFFCRQRTKA